MKFGKSLQRQIEETLPEWRDKFLSYKYLKKRLKFMSAAVRRTEAEDVLPVPNKRRRIDAKGATPGSDSLVSTGHRGSSSDCSSNASNQADDAEKGYDIIRGMLTAEEADFMDLLNPELEKFNVFFVEKEEEYIIRQKELQDRIETVKNRSGPNGVFPCESDYNREMAKIRKDIVNFHGEMVLLENYSSLNYTGLMKIIKKHDKRTGGVLRLPFIESVLQQPFFKTDVLLKLVKECENTLQHLFPSKEQSGEIDVKEVPAVAFNCTWNCKGEGVLHRSTVAALRTITEMRRGSSTYSVFSLPPLY